MAGIKKYKPKQRNAKRLFSKTAGRVHKFNTMLPIARGGTRL
jgi:hypothetical protein